MGHERFQNSPSGKPLRVGKGDSAYWAYVPNPLPPKLEFDTEIVQVLSNADRALGELSGLGRAMPNPHLMIGPFIRKEAVQSSRIEGTQADITDLYVYEAGQLSLPGHKSTTTESDVHEVSNYVRALEYGLERINELPVSLRLIRELHERLMEGVRGGRAISGEFRRSQNWIGPPGCSLNEATFVPPPVEAMNGALDSLERYLHADAEYPPLVRIALIHSQFEAIHPFLDGNGRIGRLLISLLLVHWQLLPLPLLYLSAYFERHRQTYYDLLLGISESGNWRDWLLFFLRGVDEQSRQALTQAKALQDLQSAYRNQVMQAGGSALLMRLADSLFESPVLTIPEAQAILKVTYVSAQRNIGKLVDLGILEKADQSSYGKAFVSAGILRIVGENADHLG